MANDDRLTINSRSVYDNTRMGTDSAFGGVDIPLSDLNLRDDVKKHGGRAASTLEGNNRISSTLAVEP